MTERVRVGSVLTLAEHLTPVEPSYLVAEFTPVLADGATGGWEFWLSPTEGDVFPLKRHRTADIASADACRAVEGNHAGCLAVVSVSHNVCGLNGDSRGLPTACVVDLYVHPLFTADMTDGPGLSVDALREALVGWYRPDPPADVPFGEETPAAAPIDPAAARLLAALRGGAGAKTDDGHEP